VFRLASSGIVGMLAYQPRRSNADRDGNPVMAVGVVDVKGPTH
jgi:hypothetical protein